MKKKRILSGVSLGAALTLFAGGVIADPVFFYRYRMPLPSVEFDETTQNLGFSVPDLYVGETVSSTLPSPTNGSPPFAYQSIGAPLPSGTAVASEGIIVGTPVSSGAYSGFRLGITDKMGASATLTAAGPIMVYDLPVINDASIPDGYVGVVHPGVDFGVEGGKSPFVWSMSAGSVPGMAVSGAGRFSGTPSAAGAFPFTVRVVDENGRDASRSGLTITVYENPLGTASSGPADGYVGEAYPVLTLTTAGGKQPTSWSVGSGTVPPGLSLGGDGLVHGNPTSSGNFPFVARLSDANGRTSDVPLSIHVYDLPSVTNAPSAQGYQDVAYAPFDFAAAGGKAPLAWAVSGQPSGMGVSSAGRLSGTPGQAGDYTINVTVTDANGRSASRQAPLLITALPTLTTAPSADGYVGTAYTFTYAATGGRTPYSYTVSSGAVPSGLTLGTTGQFAGSPTTPAAYAFTVQATDGNGKTASLPSNIVVYAPPALTAAPSADGYVGTAYGFDYVATGGKAPLSYAVTTGTAPTGTTLSSTGRLSGAPSVAGSYGFTVAVTDANGRSSSLPTTLTVLETLALGAGPGTDAYVGTPYSFTFATTGGKAPVVVAVSSGTIPAGLSLSGTGVLSGTPSAPGAHSFTATATDANGRTADRASSLTVYSPPALASGPAADGYVGSAYSFTYAAAGGKAAYTYAVTTGSLPTGLTLSSAGVISGTPSAAGTFNFTVMVTDANGRTAARASSVLILSNPVISAGPTGDGYTDTGYGFTYSTSGGSGGYSYAVTSGSMPNGLSLSGATITGTPTSPGTYNFTVTSTDSNGKQSSRASTIVVYSPVSVSSGGVPNYQYVTWNYTHTFTSTGGKGPVSWAVVSGSLPPGLGLGSNGVIQGTISGAGTYGFTTRVTDANGRIADQYNVIVVYNVVWIANTPPSSYQVNSGVSAWMSAGGGNGSYYWAASSMPPGLGLASNGQIYGTPTASGWHTISASVWDGNGIAASGSWSVYVSPAPANFSWTLFNLNYYIGWYDGPDSCSVKMQNQCSYQWQEDTCIGSDGYMYDMICLY